MEKEYAQAIYSLAQEPDASAKDLVGKLMEHLQATGRVKLLPRILRELRRIEARAASLSETFEVASAGEKAAAEKEAHALGITAHARVNHDLISGWRARTGSRLIDRSGRRALLDLYRRIVASA
jgi:F0F1-type ATP synthase delta subunit